MLHAYSRPHDYSDTKSIGDQTQTPNFWLCTNKHLEPNRAFASFYQITHRTDSNIIFSNIEQTRMCSSIGNRTRTRTLFLASNDQTFYFEHSSTPHFNFTKQRISFLDKM